MGGHNFARHNQEIEECHNIGIRDIDAGHTGRGLKHLVIAASDGYQPSLTIVKEGYKLGGIKKEDYAKALRAFQESTDAVKSKQREDGLKMLTFLHESAANPDSGLAQYLRSNARKK